MPHPVDEVAADDGERRFQLVRMGDRSFEQLRVDLKRIIIPGRAKEREPRGRAGHTELGIGHLNEEGRVFGFFTDLDLESVRKPVAVRGGPRDRSTVAEFPGARDYGEGAKGHER
jgi:hypothetical protein